MPMFTPGAHLTLIKGNKSGSSTGVAAALELVVPLGFGPWLSFKELVKNPFHGGFFNALGSGSNVDFLVFPKPGGGGAPPFLGGFAPPNECVAFRSKSPGPNFLVVPSGGPAFFWKPFAPIGSVFPLGDAPAPMAL
eukprot:FR735523.1.p5 GENE.FR735523.1~~FR735523.1.p5  ORF type:complete len:136 (-),score=34.82 FR735523.1:170-577(-)